MRGILIHFIDAPENELIKWLDANFKRQKNCNWEFPDTAETVLWISIYRDILTEFEPDEYEKLIETLGNKPSVSVAIDVSGRVDGTKELTEVVLKILDAFDGLAVDDFSDRFWSKREIEESLIFDGKEFFDFK